MTQSLFRNTGIIANIIEFLPRTIYYGQYFRTVVSANPIKNPKDRYCVFSDFTCEETGIKWLSN